MKKLFLVLLLLLFCSGIVSAKTLKWDALTILPDGYTAYWTGTAVGNKTTTDTQIDIDTLNLLPGAYTFVVKAFNVTGESGPSNEAIYTMDGYLPPVDNVAPVTIVIPGPVTIIVNQSRIN